jgi:hypothetical protein
MNIAALLLCKFPGQAGFPSRPNIVRARFAFSRTKELTVSTATNRSYAACLLFRVFEEL